MEQYIKKSAVIAEIEKLQKYRRGVFNEFDQGFDEGRDSAFDDILSFLNTLEVKEVDLKKEIDIWYDKFATNNKFDWNGFAQYFFELGINAKVADAHLWHPADGDDLPELEREVVVFTQNFPNDVGIMKVGIAHRPNPNGWDGRNILTGEVNHYTPKTYGKGGWSLPDVKIWLDCPMPYKEGGEG